MATGRRGREERLNERLRGAQRTNLDSDDGAFQLDIDGIAQPFGQTSPATSSVQASSPNVARKRRSGSNDATQMPPPRTRPSARISESPVARGARSSSALQSIPERPPSSPAGVRQARQQDMEDVVTESPANKPGSGHRVRVLTGDVTNSTSRLRALVDNTDSYPPSSSPLARKSRPGTTVAPSVRSAMSQVRTQGSDDSQEDSMSQENSVVYRRAEPDSPEQSEAEEMDDVEAARTIGLKRPRQVPVRSPDLGSPITDRTKRQKTSPVAQKQPNTKTGKRGPGRPRGRPPKAASVKSGRSDMSRRSASGDDAAIEITVQRFVNNRAEGYEDDSDDPLQEEIPFANKATETVVDVLAQVCEEVIEGGLRSLRKKLQNPADAARHKEHRIKMRAIEAYREELSSRLLQHSIHLNHWHSLKKRLRHIQKQKTDLYDEILKIKAEREQVALQMDAIRIKHENDTKDSKHRLNASTIMHDVDLAVEQGQDQPELPPRQQQEAEIANLGLLISQIADQASTSSAGGGLFNQLRDFNAFLERAAVALESR